MMSIDSACGIAHAAKASAPWVMVQRALARPGTALLLVAVVACSSLTDVETDLVEQDDLDNANGALALRVGAFQDFNFWMPEFAAHGGLLADELTYLTGASIGADGAIDSRTIDAETVAATWPGLVLSGSQSIQVFVDEAITAMRRHAPEPAWRIGDLFAVRGYTLLLLADHFCSGLANVSIERGQPMPGPSRTTDELLALALAAFDTAAVMAEGNTSVAAWAAVGRGRALLSLGRFSDAAAAVADVPTAFVREINYDGASFENRLLTWLRVSTAADREGANGLSFVSADDPRLALVAEAEDGSVSWRPAKYADSSSPFVLADGIEARLIEAESALQSDDVAGWLQVHNLLRAGVGLPALSDPGSAAARVDLHFQERAFWLFLTAHRLGDLRRLIRQYGWSPEDVFPTGPYKGGPAVYGSATFFPAPAAERTNPQFTGCVPDA